MNGDETPRKIKVVDRRRFTDDGEPRPGRPEVRAEAVAPVDPSQPESGVGQSQSTDTSDTITQPRRETSPVFLELVATLAQQAELFMVGEKGFPREPAQAQRLIDYLGAIEDVTQGNLSAEEEQVLSNVLFQLRSMFVQHGG